MRFATPGIYYGLKLYDSLSISEECVVSKPKVRNAEIIERLVI